MKLDPRQYDEMVSRASPPSPVVRDCAWAFLVGGAICTLGEALRQFFLIWYDKTLAAKAGAGTLVPITGFANSVVSPAIEFKAEGWVTGVGARIFGIAGPVIAFGTLASFVWGVLYWLLGKVG